METNTFELHVFSALQPDEGTVELFKKTCAGAPSPMKSLLLDLDFVGQGFVGVLQSSRYVQGELAGAIEAIHADAAAIAGAGLSVLREKIEAVATSPCVPPLASDPRAADPGRYFEIHMLFAPHGGEVTPGHEQALLEVSRRMTAQLGRPVPRSYNVFKPQLRFLNLRSYLVGLAEARADVERVCAEVEATGLWGRSKVIEEYVCFDTNRGLDRGWLEPLEG